MDLSDQSSEDVRKEQIVKRAIQGCNGLGKDGETDQLTI